MLSFLLSNKLPGVILRGSPSLLWMAANSGDSEIFEQLLTRLDVLPDVGKPEQVTGATSITQIALSKGFDDILGCAISRPRLFPR